MMPEQDLLQQLRDIHLPQALSKWPLAPGWFVLFGLIIGMVSVLTIWLWRRWSQNRIKREALRLLAQYEKNYYQQSEVQSTSAAVNELLKRVALAYFPRQEVARLHGQDWLLFLQNTSKNLNFIDEGSRFVNCPYQPNQRLDLRPWFQLVREWISQRERLCLS